MPFKENKLKSPLYGTSNWQPSRRTSLLWPGLCLLLLVFHQSKWPLTESQHDLVLGLSCLSLVGLIARWLIKDHATTTWSGQRPPELKNFICDETSHYRYDRRTEFKLRVALEPDGLQSGGLYWPLYNASQTLTRWNDPGED